MEETKSIVEAGSALFADIELVKVIVSFVGVLLTALAAGVIGYFAREAPIKTVKLEQLKFISQLTKDRAWKDPSYNFVIEEAFREYFKVFIPIEIIKTICVSKSRYYGFVFYSQVRDLIEFEENKFVVPHQKNISLFRAILGAWSLFFIHIGAILIGTVYATFVTLEGGINFSILWASFLSCLVALAFFYIGWVYLRKAAKIGEQMDSFIKELGDDIKIKPYSREPENIAALIFPTLVVLSIWGVILYVVYVSFSG